MNVLVTGQRGRLGSVVAKRLEAVGHAVSGFDARDGRDVRDAAALRRAAAGAAAVVHLAGLPDDANAPPDEVMAVSLLGTWNVLLAARAAGVERVVCFSSGKALGMLERPPAYLPVDDDHPGLPSRPYGLAKWLAEEMCEACTRETGIATICLRPVAVLTPDDPAPRDPPPGRPWHLGVWVDVRDVADATAAALTCPHPGHARLLLCADDVAADRPTLELVAEHLPDVEWRGGPEYDREPQRALVDCSRAREVLGWRPRRRWAQRRTSITDEERGRA